MQNVTEYKKNWSKKSGLAIMGLTEWSMMLGRLMIANV
tara:strand:- start:220 stop:333 length:114 start_codon:yes stop_codon:yes gene_type:complete